MQSNNYCVLLAGGVGSRFWPYSRKSKPKQFLDFFGTGESLLQMTYRRYRTFFDADKIFVVTNQLYRDIVVEQLPELSTTSLLLEPIQRNTSAAIAYASKHIASLCKDAILTVVPTDHLVTKEEVLIAYIKKATEQAQEIDATMILGIKPSYPETGYGYIQVVPHAGEEEIREGVFYPVKTFTEKPNKQMAKILVDSGEFFWNSGIFIAKAAHFINELNEHFPELTERIYKEDDVWGGERESSFLKEEYPYCPSVSFDYAVMEKSHNVQMLLCDVGWADLGTWSSVHALSDKDKAGNASVGKKPIIYNDSSNNLVVTDKEEGLLVLQGISDAIVVQQEDIIVICRKGEEQKLKQVLPEVAHIDAKLIE